MNPRQLIIFVSTFLGYSTLPRMHQQISTASPDITRITARTFSTESTYATLPRMSSTSASQYHPTRGDVISSSSHQRFAQAMSTGESGYSSPSYASPSYASPSYGRSSPLVSSSPRSSLSSSSYYSATGFNKLLILLFHIL